MVYVPTYLKYGLLNFSPYKINIQSAHKYVLLSFYIPLVLNVNESILLVHMSKENS